MHKLAIIIVNYRVPRLVEQALRSVVKASEGLDTEVWLVDNNSGDGSVAYLEERFPQFNYIANDENLGFAKANNLAIKQCNSEYILLLNPDTIIAEDTLKLCTEYMDKTAQCGALGVKMHDIHGQYLRESKRGFPSVWRSFCKLAGLAKLFPHSKTFAGYYLGHLSDDKVQCVEALCFAYTMFRKETLDEVGLMDERFFMYGEDIDLSYRIAMSRYECHYLPTTIIHYKGESSILNNKTYQNSFYGAMSLFFDKYYGHRKLFSAVAGSLIKFAIKFFTLTFAISSRFRKKKEVKFACKREVCLPLYSMRSGEELIIKAEDYTYREIIDSIVASEGLDCTFHLAYKQSGLISPKS